MRQHRQDCQFVVRGKRGIGASRLMAMAVLWALLSPARAADKPSGSPAPAAASPAAASAGATPGIASPAVEAEGPNEASLQARLKQLESLAGLAADDRAKLVDVYQQALALLETSDRLELKAADYARQRTQAPQTQAALQQELAAPPVEQPVALDVKMSLGQLEQALANAQAQLSQLDSAAGQIDSERKRRAERRAEIPKLTATANERLVAAESQLVAPQSPDESPELALSRRELAQAERRAVKAEIECYRQELLSYEATADLLPLEQDKLARARSQAQRLVQHCRELVDERRRLDAAESARKAQAALCRAARAHPAVQKLAAENARMAQQRTQLAELIEQTSHLLEKQAQQLAALDKEFAKLQDKAKLTHGANLGLLLHKQQSELPDPRQLRREVKLLAATISAAQLELLDLHDRRGDLGDLEPHVARHLTEVAPGERAIERVQLEEALREYCRAERENVDALIEGQDQYLQELVALSAAYENLADKSQDFDEYIAERVLWVRSTTPLALSHLAGASHALDWFSDLDGWYGVGEALVTNVLHVPQIYLLMAAVFIFLWRMRRVARAQLRELGVVAARAHTESFRPTARAIGFTVLAAALWPAVCAMLGWRLWALGPAARSESLGLGLLTTAGVFFVLEITRQVCRPHGLGEAHFAWSSRGLTEFRRNLQRFMVAALPLVLLLKVIETLGRQDWDDSLGRCGFLLFMAMLALFLQRTLRPSGGVLDEVLAKNPQGWFARLRYSWFVLAIGAPSALAVLALVGYHFTAVQLAWRLMATASLMCGLILVHALLMRLLLLARRHLAFEQLRQKRAAMCEGREGPPVSCDPAHDLAKLDPGLISQQTRKLLRSALACGVVIGLYAVWVDVLPALQVLNKLELWSTTVDVVELTTENGVEVPRHIPRHVPITLANVLLAAVVVMMTVLATRNLPGLLEITLLQRLPFEAAGRYAITTISRYAITVAGCVTAFSLVGIGWSKVQWLAAAITVGLGFGLQEIFANFVSGLIILFERPIRVGDTITVGATSGTVSRIRIRATTILDGDRKELIVPNKEFITGQVINWTLTDEIVRLQIPIRIAYGSDTELVERLILRATAEHPLVLRDPAPSALLEDFGDQTLNFYCRVYLASVSHMGRVRHELLAAINKSFSAAGIEIANPAQDVRLRVLDPDLASLVRRRAAS
ncbi:MAG: mechanosensitive ion channel [Pirellulales bacterium]|nr:mechanosensitive ion channel [Pirellulales bacterium]